jgi:PAS domain S-box-containing protein
MKDAEAIHSHDSQGNQIRPYRILVASSLIVPAVLCAIIAWQDYKSVLRATEREVLRTTDIFHRQALNVFETHQLVAEAVNEKIEGRSWDEIGRSQAIHGYLKTLVDKYPQVQAIWLADASGTVRKGSQPLPASPVSVADCDYFRTLRQTDVGMFVGHIVKARVMKVLNFNLACRRKGGSGAFDGVIIITVSPEYFRNFWNEVMPREETAVALIRGDGMMLARAPRLDPDILQLPATASSAQAIRSAEKGSFYGRSSHDRSERLYAFRKLGSYDAYIVYGIGLKNVHQEWRKHLVTYGTLFGAASAALLLTALSALRQARQLTEKSTELESTTQRLQLATTSGQLGVWEWDIKAGTIIWNDRMFDLYGLPRRSCTVELAAWEKGVHPEDRLEATAAVQSAISGEKQFDTEFRVVHPDGTTLHIKADGLVVRDSDGKAVHMIGINRDISEQIRIKMELLNHKEHLEELVRIRTGELARMVKALRKEMEERLKTEEALRESEERFRLMADTAPVMIWEAGPDARGTFFNRPWLEFTGRTLEQELGDGWTKDIHPDDIERCMDTYLSAFKDRQRFSLEYRLRRADGEYGWIVATGVPRLAPDGDLLGYIGTCFDITERNRLREELQQANELLVQRVAERTAELSETIEKLKNEINERLNVQAELREKELLLLQQSRLAAMGEMICNIAHQWRQPLNMLGLLAQELPMNYKKGDFSAEYLEDNVKKMLETIRHMSKTIDDFRYFSLPGKEKVDFRIREIIGKTISLLEGSLSAQQIKCAVVAACDPVVNGYPNEFSQVLLNIMINARDAFVTQKVTSPTITIKIVTEGDRCVVTITDNAGGIPEEIIGKIFDPYFTTKGPDKGTGVGLYMSKTIIEKNMKGTLSARNVGDGAEFRIEI